MKNNKIKKKKKKKKINNKKNNKKQKTKKKKGKIRDQGYSYVCICLTYSSAEARIPFLLSTTQKALFYFLFFG